MVLISLPQSIIEFGARDIFVVNLPPLGCTPALLTQYYGSLTAKYDGHGCLSDLNKITAAHNKQLGDKMVKLRAKYPDLLLLYGDMHGVYTDILKNPAAYSKFKLKLYTFNT